MNAARALAGKGAFATLRGLARPRATAEQCEFCSLALPPGHRHVLEVASRKIICSCDGCALRFESVIGRYKLIPRDTWRLPEFKMTDAQWDALGLPIQLAFFVHNSSAGKVLGFYPSPAGVTESLLPLSIWEELVSENCSLRQMEADVQALLVNRLNGGREYFLAALDVCFELAGLIRMHWRGFSGGDKVWTELESFFSRVREASSIYRPRAEEVVDA